jgi:ribosomal protein L11 methyltransferase
LGRNYPALDVRCDDAELLMAAVDDFSPTAIEERDGAVRVFFARATDRDAAKAALEDRFGVAALDVPDEDWARRSQDNLQPITIGALTIVPTPESRLPSPGAIVIQPSMGFGTGHHATTRLCLEALQTLDLAGSTVLDIGTGSGVLAIAAARLGAFCAIGVDVDEDAIAAARENLALNADVADRVTFEVADVEALHPFTNIEVVTANLTGARLVRSARTLIDLVRGGGVLIVSGLQVHERDDVVRAFPGTSTVWERMEDEWVGLVREKTVKSQPAGPGSGLIEVS